MAISEAAHRNHEQLFPNHKSTLTVSDPELIEIFDNFAFDEVIAHTELDTKTRLILTLAAIIGAHGINEFRVMVAAALNVGVSDADRDQGDRLRFHATNEVLTSRGVKLPLEGQSTTDTTTRQPGVGGAEDDFRHDDRRDV